MQKQTETCPWCHGQVQVDPGRRRLYRCSSCGRNFTYTPSAAQVAGGEAAAAPAQPGIPPPEDFVETPFIRDLVHRTMAYLEDRLPVHLTGPAGCGKTTLALHMAHQLGRPVVLIHGDDEMGTADLVGKESGYQRRYIRDQFIHTVIKIEEEAKPLWVGRALTEACQEGYTVVYDEFTRSRPEANNVLLSVLEEQVLPLRGQHIPVHPDFRAIFTSNPAEYAGVHGVQDALLDRLVTIQLEGMDRDTEVAIAAARSELPPAEVERIVDLVRAFRQLGFGAGVSSVRPSIMIARILRARRGRAYAGDSIFIQTCRDALLSEARRTRPDHLDNRQLEESLQHLIQKLCSDPLPQEHPALAILMAGRRLDDLLADLVQDKDIEELVLKKIREKRLRQGLLSDMVGREEGPNAEDGSG